MKKDITYKILHNIFCDESFKSSYFSDPDGIIRKEGILEQDKIDFLKNFVFLAFQTPVQNPELKQCQESEMKSHYSVLENIREGLNKTIKQMINGYSRTMTMYTISFYLGILLIVSSIIYAFVNSGSQNNSLLTIIFAGLGTADIISYFISSPPLKLQKSRSDLAQLQASYFAWYQDLRYWIEYLTAEYWNRYQKGINNSDPELASNASNEYKKTQELVSSMIINHTAKILGMIEKYVEPVSIKELKDVKKDA